MHCKSGGIWETAQDRALVTADGILPGAKFTLCPNVAFSYIGSVTARHSSSGRQPNFVVWYKEWIWNFRTGRQMRHLYSAGRPSHWASAHILVSYMHCCITPQTRKFEAYDDHGPFLCIYDTFEWCGTGMAICLERGTNDLHMVQLMPLPPHHLLLQ